MDVIGAVTAVSEVIRFEEGRGILLSICNEQMKIKFYVLVHEAPVILLRNVSIGSVCLITNLRVGTLETVSGIKQVLFKTNADSTFVELDEDTLLEFRIPKKLQELIFKYRLEVPFYYFNSKNSSSCSPIISYEGYVTDAVNSENGIYELDNKILLYLAYNVSAAAKCLQRGTKVLASNVHLINHQKRKIFVCCGLSSIICNSIEQEENETCSTYNSSLTSLLYQFNLNIYDVLWLEEFFTSLNMKFCPTMVSGNKLFSWSSEIIGNILMILSDSTDVKNLGLCEEFCSYPHVCAALSEGSLPIGCSIPYISEILNEATNRIVWQKLGKNWEISFVENQMKFLLIGILYLSRDGNFYLTDQSSSLPVIFTESCQSCKDDKNITCTLNARNGALVAIQDFNIVFEKILCNNGNKAILQYIKASYCSVFHVATLSKIKNTFLSFELKLPFKSESKEKMEEFVQRKMHYKNDVKDLSFVALDSIFNGFSNIYQQFIVLHKIWKISNKVAVCCDILVLFIFDLECKTDFIYDSEDLDSDSYNFYKTDDDVEFAELIDKMDNLFLETKSKVALMKFDSPSDCISLLPGHMYYTDLQKACKMNAFCTTNSDARTNNLKVTALKISSPEHLLHSSNCLANHSLEECEALDSENLKEVVEKR